MYKYTSIALLSVCIPMVYAASTPSFYIGYYCKVNGKPVSGWDYKCDGKTTFCDVFGNSCKYCDDCSIALGVCQSKGGELWRTDNSESWYNGGGEGIKNCLPKQVPSYSKADKDPEVLQRLLSLMNRH